NVNGPMKGPRSRREDAVFGKAWLSGLALGLTLLAGCAPAASNAPAPPSAGSARSQEPARQPKTLTIALQGEPAALNVLLGGDVGDALEPAVPAGARVGRDRDGADAGPPPGGHVPERQREVPASALLEHRVHRRRAVPPGEVGVGEPLHLHDV